MNATLAAMMAEYAEVSAKVKDLDQRKTALREGILTKMREQGAGVEGIEAGGYRASIHYREYFGFKDTMEDGSPVEWEERERRLKALHAFFKKHAPERDVPSSENMAKAWEAYLSTLAEEKREDAPLPSFFKKSETPILRVSGGGAK